MLYQLLQSQSTLWAYIEQFRLLVLVCLVCAALVFLLSQIHRFGGGGDDALSVSGWLFRR